MSSAVVALYGDGDQASCTGLGPQTAFPATTVEVVGRVYFDSWHGDHSVAGYWYRPNGSLFTTDKGALTGEGPTTWCTWMPIANQQPAPDLGQWKLVVAVDGDTKATATFSIFAAAPTAIPTPASSAINVLAPAVPQPAFAYKAYHDSQFDGVIYTAGNQYAIAGLNCGGTQCGYQAGSVNASGLSADTGFMYVWIYVEEGVQQYGSSFYSSFLNFKLRSSDGTVRTGVGDAPPLSHQQLAFNGASIGEGERNGGWIRFEVPAKPDRYDLIWTATPYDEAVTSFSVSP